MMMQSLGSSMIFIYKGAISKDIFRVWIINNEMQVGQCTKMQKNSHQQSNLTSGCVLGVSCLDNGVFCRLIGNLWTPGMA